MIKFYYFPSTNPAKVALLLEEVDLPYEMVPVEIRKGEQFSAAFRALNPNQKTPVLIDDDVILFDSTAIMLHLAEKTGRFTGSRTVPARAELLSWLMFVATGIGPYSGQAVYFQHFGKDPTDDAAVRYAYEAERHWRIVDDRLATARYMLGDSYSIVDMSIWPWARALERIVGVDAWTNFLNVTRLLDEVNARPAARRATSLATRHTFKMEMDEMATALMFPYRSQVNQC